MGAGGSVHPAGNRMAPGLKMKSGSNYRMYWTLRPEEPDRYNNEKRFDKFRDLPEVSKPVWAFDLAQCTMVLAAAVADGGVYLWDLLHHQNKPQVKVVLGAHTAHVWDCLFSPNELALATASSDKTIRIWKAEDGTPIQVLEAHTAGVRCLAFSMDGVLLSGGMDCQICMWEYECSVPTAQWKAHEGHVHAISFIVDNRLTNNRSLALSTGADGHVAAWCVADGTYKALGRFAGGDGKGVLCVAQHTHQDNWCACGNEDGGIWMWNFAALDFNMDLAGSTTEEIEILGSIKLAGHKQGVRTLAFTPDGFYLASGSADGTIRVWDVRKVHEKSHVVGCVCVFNAHDSWVTQLRFEGGSCGLVSCSSDGFVKHWAAPARIRNTKRLEEPQFVITIHRLPGFTTYGLGVDFKFQDDGLLVCKVSKEGLVEQWNKKNPSKALMPGMFVVSANDVEGSGKAIMEVCKNANPLQMTVKMAPAHRVNMNKEPDFEKTLANLPALRGWIRKIVPDHTASMDEWDDEQHRARHLRQFRKDPDEKGKDAIVQVQEIFRQRHHHDDEVDDDESDDGDGSAQRELALADQTHLEQAALPAPMPGAVSRDVPVQLSLAALVAGEQGRIVMPPHRQVLPRALLPHLAALGAIEGGSDFGYNTPLGSTPTASSYAVVH